MNGATQTSQSQVFAETLGCINIILGTISEWGVTSSQSQHIPVRVQKVEMKSVNVFNVCSMSQRTIWW